MGQLANTAILLFSRTPQEEAAAKRLASRPKTVEIAQLLQAQALRQAHLTRLPVFEHNGQQIGSNFGERLANAMEATFAQGFEQLIVIGNDSPDLDSKAILEAQQQMANDNLVLGPALDGGVYLIGIKVEAYQRKRFIQLAWETAALQNTFVEYATAQQLQITQLAPLGDIDDAEDLHRLLSSLAATDSLFIALHAILWPPLCQRISNISFRSLRSSRQRRGLSLRAPPRAA